MVLELQPETWRMMAAVFVVVALVGAMSLFFGWNDVRSGRIDQDEDADSELLSSLRSVGQIFLRIGQALLLIGVFGLALSVLLQLVL